MYTDSTGTSYWSDFWKGVGNWFVDAGNAIAGAATNAWNWVSGAATDAWNWTTNAATTAWNWTSNAAVTAWNWTTNAATVTWNWTKNTAVTVWDWTANAATAVWDWIKVDNFRHVKAIFELLAAIAVITGGIAVFLNPASITMSIFSARITIVAGLVLAGFAIADILK